ncbi:hypothetical protein CBS101457_000171 [Exobasidium rhododendri]|nr:hypothetical protein CBS101457_000171 [Exobasidium rhododendri]
MLFQVIEATLLVCFYYASAVVSTPMDGDWHNPHLGSINTRPSSRARHAEHSGSRTSRPAAVKVVHDFNSLMSSTIPDGSQTSRPFNQARRSSRSARRQMGDVPEEDGIVLYHQQSGLNVGEDQGQVASEQRSRRRISRKSQVLDQQEQTYGGGDAHYHEGTMNQSLQEGSSSGSDAYLHGQYGMQPYMPAMMDHLSASYAHNMNVGSSSDYPVQYPDSSMQNYDASAQQQQDIPSELQQYNEDMAAYLQQYHALDDTQVHVNEEDQSYQQEVIPYHHQQNVPSQDVDLSNHSLAYLRRLDPLYQPDSDTASTGEYVRPWEYMLQTFTDVQRPVEEDDLVWQYLDKDQKMLVTELIRQIRPYAADTIQMEVKRKLTAKAARLILSYDLTRIERGVDMVYEFGRAKRGNQPYNWMAKFSNSDRRRVVDILADATMQPTDVIREQFLANKVSHETANLILENGNNLEKLLKLAYKKNLFFHVDGRRLPMAEGTQSYSESGIDTAHGADWIESC